MIKTHETYNSDVLGLSSAVAICHGQKESSGDVSVSEIYENCACCFQWLFLCPLDLDLAKSELDLIHLFVPNAEFQSPAYHSRDREVK